MKPSQLDKDLFDRLARVSGDDLISIFIPTHQRGREVAQDRIRLKNQLSVVDDALEQRGWRTNQRAERLELARQLLDERDFWEHQSAGLSLFIDDERQATPVSVPVTVDPFSYVGEVFHVRHLIPGMGVATVPILVLAMKSVRLMVGTRHSINEVEADLPVSFEDVNWFVDREKERQQHPDRVGSTSNRHGHEPSSREDEDRSRFLRAVAEALPEAVKKEPLVILGDDDLVERFRNGVDFDTVSPKNSGVGAPQDDGLILDLARPSLIEIETSREAEALKAAMSRVGEGQASTSIRDALPGAVAGRVGEVVIRRGLEPLWGRLDAQDMTVTVNGQRAVADVDLLDRLVVEAYKTGARITTVSDPIDGDSFIAVFRY